MKFHFILLLFFCTQFCLGQSFTVKNVVVSGEEGEYSFPLLESTKNPAMAAKVNKMIADGYGFDFNTKQEEYPESEFRFEVGGMNDRLISLVTIGSHDAMGHHERRNFYNIDARTGIKIELNQVLSAEGQQKMRKALHKHWKEKVKEGTNGQMAVDDYKDCLANVDKETEKPIDEFLFLNNGLRVWTAICLDGTMEAYDPSRGPYDFSIGQLLPMLTPYGYSLFVNKSTAPIQTLLRGSIDNKYPISLTILNGSTPGTIGGMIVYDRVGEPINISGTMEGNHFVFHELDGSNALLSDIDVSWDGTKLTGTFMSLKTKKTMMFGAVVVK